MIYAYNWLTIISFTLRHGIAKWKILFIFKSIPPCMPVPAWFNIVLPVSTFSSSVQFSCYNQDSPFIFLYCIISIRKRLILTKKNQTFSVPSSSRVGTSFPSLIQFLPVATEIDSSWHKSERVKNFAVSVRFCLFAAFSDGKPIQSSWTLIMLIVGKLVYKINRKEVISDGKERENGWMGRSIFRVFGE